MQKTIGMLTALTFILGVVLGVLMWPYLKQLKQYIRHKHKHFGHSKEQWEEMLTTTLHELNCEVEIEKTKENVSLLFTYQSGNFQIMIEDNNPFPRLSYIQFFQTKLNYIQYVRQACNRCNLNTENVRLVYTVPQGKNEVGVHVLSGIMATPETAKSVLVRMLNDVFGWKLAFTNYFFELQNAEENRNLPDPELTGARNKIEFYLLNQQATHMQQANVDATTMQQSGFSVARIMEVLAGVKEVEAVSLTYTYNGNLTGVEQPEIAGFMPLEILKTAPENANEPLWMVLRYKRPGPNEGIHEAMAMVKPVEKVENTTYCKLTLTLPSVETHFDNELQTITDSALCKEVLVAFDREKGVQENEKFMYWWKEAKKKLEENQGNKLTEDEKRLAECTHPQVAFDLQKGQSLYEQHRFMEAVLPLRRAFDTLMTTQEKLPPKEQRTFEAICYLLGCCHSFLNNHETAIYYLEMLTQDNNMRNLKALVNASVKARDFRSLDMLDRLIKDVTEHLSNTDAEPMDSDLQRFLIFLYKRKAFVLVEKGEFDKAKSLLMPLLDNPAEADDVLNELAYIQKMENKNKQNKP